MRVRVPSLAAQSRPSPISRLFTPVAPVASLQHSTDQLYLLCFIGPETARKQLAVSSNLFAYWLFHTIAFERKVFRESTSAYEKTVSYRWLQVKTYTEAARMGTDIQIHTHAHTHKTTTVTLAHVRRGL